MKNPSDPLSVGWPTEEPKLTIEGLRAFMRTHAPDAMDTYGKKHLVLCLYVLKEFLGWDWCQTHLIGAKSGFFYMDFSTVEKKEETSIRIFELAENLFNLQTVSGVCECIDRMKRGHIRSEQIESTYAELEFGRILKLYDISFRFVPRSSDKSPDFELVYPDGTIMVADAKCKVDGSEFSESKIKNSLKEARDQFPKDGAGIAFIKIPNSWAKDAATRVRMRDAALRYIGGSRGISAVKFYAAPLEFSSTTIGYAFLEISNTKSRVQPGRDWTLFEGRKANTDWNATSSQWVDFNALAEEKL